MANSSHDRYFVVPLETMPAYYTMTMHCRSGGFGVFREGKGISEERSAWALSAAYSLHAMTVL